MLNIFNTIKEDTTKQMYSNALKLGYAILSFISYIEICFKNSVFYKLWLLFMELFYRKYTFKFIKNGEIIKVLYEYDYYSYYVPEDTFDFLIFSNGINNQIIKNIDQQVVYGKKSTEIVNNPCKQNIWFSSTLHYTIEDTVHSMQIDFNTPQYNYILSENIFDNLFIEYFVKKYYNINLKNTMYSIDILHMNFQIETFNRNQLISLQNILKKQM
jgi:hypothetical protein